MHVHKHESESERIVRVLLNERDGVQPHTVHGRVRASSIVAALHHQKLNKRPRELIFTDLEVVGELNLRGARIQHTLSFIDCNFDTAPNLSRSHLAGLILEGSTFPGIELEGADIQHDFFANGIVTNGEFDAAGITIGGQLTLIDARVSKAGSVALRLDNGLVKGGIYLGGAEVSGESNLRGLSVGGQTSMRGTRFSSPGKLALALDSLSSAGDIFFEDAIVRGEISGVSLVANAGFYLSKSKLLNSGGIALDLQGAEVRGVLDMESCTVEGRLIGSGAHFHGEVNLQNLVATNLQAPAIELDGANLRADLVMDGIVCNGTFFAPRATFGGSVFMQDAKFKAIWQTSLMLRLASVAGVLQMARVSTVGGIDGGGLRVEGDVIATAMVLNDFGATVLTLDGARIGGNLRLDGSSLLGSLSFCGGEVDGQIVAPGLRIRCSGNTAAIIEGTEVHGNVALIDHDILGTIDVADSKFRRRFVLKAGPNVIRSRLLASRSEIGSLDVGGRPQRRLELDLTDCRIGSLGLRPAEVELTAAMGVSVGLVKGPMLREFGQVEELLTPSHRRPAPVFVSQPWEAFAAALGSSGRADLSRALRARAAWIETSRTRGSMKFLRTLYGALVGHGYYPAYTVAWLVGIFMLAWGLSAASVGQFVPTDWRYSQFTTSQEDVAAADRTTGRDENSTDLYPGFSPFLYAVDVALPAAATGQAVAWRTNNSFLALSYAILRGGSWVIAAMFVAGATGLLRRL